MEIFNTLDPAQIPEMPGKQELAGVVKTFDRETAIPLFDKHSFLGKLPGLKNMKSGRSPEFEDLSKKVSALQATQDQFANMKVEYDRAFQNFREKFPESQFYDRKHLTKDMVAKQEGLFKKYGESVGDIEAVRKSLGDWQTTKPGGSHGRGEAVDQLGDLLKQIPSDKLTEKWTGFEKTVQTLRKLPDNLRLQQQPAPERKQSQDSIGPQQRKGSLPRDYSLPPKGPKKSLSR